MRRNSQPLYRVVISTAGGSETVMQDACVRSRNRIGKLDSELGEAEMLPKPQVMLSRRPAHPSASRSARRGLVNPTGVLSAVLMLRDAEENEHSRNGRGP
jgi:hypothetical protein